MNAGNRLFSPVRLVRDVDAAPVTERASTLSLFVSMALGVSLVVACAATWCVMRRVKAAEARFDQLQLELQRTRDEAQKERRRLRILEELNRTMVDVEALEVR